MKKIFLRLALHTGIVLFLLLTGMFAWANWNPPSPGERSAVVNFVPYDMTVVHDSLKAAEIASYAETLPGVKGATYNPKSKIMCVAYHIDATENQLIETMIDRKFHVRLYEKLFRQSGPRCPVGGFSTVLLRIKRFFCLRMA